ncbi:DUF177 domain-containing protein [Halarcobacter anaerophilus]|uniref:Uncharacterized protein n=1 Tax=Halarcobacter anaerophilus TaxID=877500 RepID=A0A4Q0XZF6_9BACT|nr:hypothetical protein [Halarcobacter anaerophilus]QDF30039.1 hypothetical protein AANAER_2593 [Halarcobacter anaerophilus]RXJ63086.1 hypothetical protein CRV06_07440 [Halarcobacter anaerophilus]
MKIEFRKVPQSPKEFTAEYSSVKFEGTFCKISPSLVKIQGHLIGNLTLTCSRCGIEDTVTLDEKSDFLLSDGIYKSDSDEDELVLEIENGTIDFDEILQSEIASIQSDYHICASCEDCDFVEKEY